jgi:phage-related protein
MKPVEFLGDALEALRAFPRSARREAGFQLDKVQRGREPDDWKPMKTIGAGVREIRVREASGAFRVVYLTALPDAVYVLHCFHKKGEKTLRRDIQLAQLRYKGLMRKKP